MVADTVLMNLCSISAIIARTHGGNISLPVGCLLSIFTSLYATGKPELLPLVRLSRSGKQNEEDKCLPRVNKEVEEIPLLVNITFKMASV